MKETKRKKKKSTAASRSNADRINKPGASDKYKERPLPPKLTPPRPTRLYPREHLFELLDRIRQDHAVIWMSAPGGAGKTSLATSYLAARKLPVLWYQVDVGDGDVASFFYYMGLAAVRAAPRHKKPLPILTPEYLGDLPTFTRNFFRELYRRLPASSVLVLDNYQDAPEDSRLHDVIRIAMSEVPEGLNLLVLSRVEPPSVLARQRLCDHAACLDWSKLQLTPEETAGIGAIRTGKEILDSETIATLHGRTHGWAAGVVLMIEQARTGKISDLAQTPTDQKLLFDYFASEILHRSEPVVRDFLLKTALFPKITVASALVLTGNERAHDILEDLTRRNYFTVRHAGAPENSYEYHPLFREFLRAQARTAHTPAAFDALRREAARILVQAGELEEAALLFQQSQSWAELATLICAHAPTLVAQGRYQTVQAWIAPLPEPLHEQIPWILFWHGAAWHPFDLQRARVSYERAYACFKASGADAAAGLWLSWSGIVETHVFEWARFAVLDHWIMEFYALMAQGRSPPTPELMGRAVVGIFTALMYRQPGHADLSKWAEQLESMLHRGLDPVVMTTIGMQLLMYHSWWTGDSARAQALFALIKPVATRVDLPPFAAITWCISQAIHGWIRAENDQCVAAARRGIEIARDSGVHLFDFLLRAQETCGLLTIGQMEEAAQALDQARNVLVPSRLMDVAFFHLLLATLNVDAEGARQARVHGEQCLNLTRECGCPWGIGQALGYAVWASVRTGDSTAAEKYLHEYRSIAWRTGSDLAVFVFYYVEWYMRVKQGDRRQTLAALQSACVSARNLGLANWLLWPYPETAQFCAQALAHDIEPDYIRALIKKRNLLPPTNEAVPDTWPFPIKIRTLGRFALLKDDQPLATATGKGHKKPLELLHTLIALGGRQVGVEKIVNLLWPDAEGDAGVNLFKITLHRLRKLLGRESAIDLAEGRLTLNTQEVWVDSWALARTLADADVKSNDPAHQADAARCALALYRGHFLEHEAEGNPALLRPANNCAPASCAP